MYIPAAFVESDLPTLHAFIDRHSFGLLVTHQDGAPFATHLPLLLDRTAGPYGTLFGHVARANPQWEQFGNRQALAVFSGPHAYVSPTWYEAENVVPTWNYVAVHAYGKVRLVRERDELLDILRRSVEVYERSMPRPWALAGSDVFLDRMVAQVVGFRLEIDRLEGKWKLSQNHPIDRQEKVIRALAGRGGEDAAAVAALMRERLDAASGR